MINQSQYGFRTHFSPALDAFIDDLANYDVSPDFGTDSMILRWRPDSPISWNLGTIVSSGQLWMDYMGQQAKNAGLGDSHKRYLESLTKLVPVRLSRKHHKRPLGMSLLKMAKSFALTLY
jgi:hypothetical protein